MRTSPARLVPALLLLTACPRGAAPEPVDTWVQLEGSDLATCLPSPASELRRGDRVRWASLLERLTAPTYEPADHEIAQELIEELKDPQAAALGHRLLDFRDASFDRDQAADAWAQAASDRPDNGCVQFTAATIAIVTRRSKLALDASARAHALLPDQASVAALRFLILEATDQEPVQGERSLEQTFERFADQPALGWLLGQRYLDQDRPAEAVQPLVVASKADFETAPLLLEATRRAGMLDRYLRLASAQDLPLGDGRLLSTVNEPVRAFAEQLGVDDEGRLTAHIETSQGTLTCDLAWRAAPVTVANFVGLARGEQPWTDPETGETRTDPLYDGTVMHRVIPSFMVQGGDPTGTGSGGPGYRFLDETAGSPFSFDRPGVLAMANSGPDTNGSQFFVTEVPLPYLDGKHTIFGQCDPASVQVVKRIARLPTDTQDRPQDPVYIERVRIGSVE